MSEKVDEIALFYITKMSGFGDWRNGMAKRIPWEALCNYSLGAMAQIVRNYNREHNIEDMSDEQIEALATACLTKAIIMSNENVKMIAKVSRRFAKELVRLHQKGDISVRDAGLLAYAFGKSAGRYSARNADKGS